MELLEARQLLAAVTDNGTTLTIDLAAGEVLTVASLGTSYSFTSSSSFVNGGTASATDFSGFGTTGLTLESAGLARYDSIQIVDSGAAARVIFSGSGSHAYTDSFVVVLNDNAGNGSQPGLMFNGATTFSGNAGLLAEIDTRIALNWESSLSTVDGDLSLLANQKLTPTAGSFIGIDVYRGTIRTTGLGDILLRGRGGDSGSDQVGVQLRGQTVIESTATGSSAGTVTIEGRGGGTAARNGGVVVDGARVESVDGDVLITGQGGGSTSSSGSRGVLLDQITLRSLGTTSGAATLTVAGVAGRGTNNNTGVSVGNLSVISSIVGAIAVTGESRLATGSNNSGFEVGGSSAIRSEGVGSLAATVTLTGSGFNFGIVTSSAEITSVSGPILLQGTGTPGNSGAASHGVSLTELTKIQSLGEGGSAASITIDGTGGSGSGQGRGVQILGTQQPVLLSSVDGPILLKGRGGIGTNSFNAGITATGLVTISSTGTGASVGSIRLEGTGGSGAGNNYGVNLDGGPLITGVDSDLMILGIAGDGTSSNNIGVNVSNGAAVRSTGTGIHAGSVVINGTGAAGTSQSHGVALFNTTGIVTAVDGSIELIGQAGLSTTQSSQGVQIATGLSVAATGAGPITLTTDRLDIQTFGANSVTAASGAIQLRQKSIGAELSYPDAMLDRVLAGTIRIGDSKSGRVQVGGITRSSPTNLEIQSGDRIEITGSIETAGGSLSFLGSPAGVQPLASGTDVVAPATTLGAPLAIRIQGTVLDSQYSHFRSSSAVNLNGQALLLSGSFVPPAGSLFKIVQAAVVSGQFSGLADGAEITLNGVPLNIVYESDGVYLHRGNVLPSLTIQNSSVTVLQGGTASNSGTFFDFNRQDTVTITASIGTITQDAGRTGNWTWSLPNASAPAFRTVTLTATDSQGGITTTTFQLFTKLRPNAHAGGPYVTNEGQAVTLSAAATTDPDTAKSLLTYAWDLNYNGVTFVPSGYTGVSPSITLPDNFPARTIAVRVSDPDGNVSIATSTLTVQNVAPTILAVNQGPFAAGQEAVVRVDFSDPAAGFDPLTLEFDVNNDGIFETAGEVNPDQRSGVGRFTLAAPGSYPVAVRVSDGDGGVVTASATLSVVPTVNFSVASSSISETAGTVLVQATLSHALPAAVSIPLMLPADLNQAGISAPSAFLTFAAGSLTGSVTLAISDDSRAQGDRAVTLSIPTGWTNQSAVRGPVSQHVLTIVDNEPPPTPPTAVAGGPYVASEGQPILLSAVGTSDAGQPASTLVYEWDLNYDGLTFQVDTTGMTPTVTFGDNTPSRPIAVRVRDADGLTSLATTSVEVQNIAPTISLVTNNGPVAANGEARISIHATDPAGSQDPLLYELDLNSDGIFETGSSSGLIVTSFAAAGSYVVPIRVSDGDGGVALSTTTIRVVPTIAFVASSSTVVEGAGTTHQIHIQLSVPAAELVSYSVGLSGTALEGTDYQISSTTVQIAPGGNSAVIGLTLLDDFRAEGNETIVLTLSGGSAILGQGVHTVTLTDNEPPATPPVANAGGPYAANELQFVTLDGTLTTDNGQPASTLTYEWDLDYVGTTFTPDASGVRPTVQFLESTASRTIALRVTDVDGLSSIATTTVSVANLNPQFTQFVHTTQGNPAFAVGRGDTVQFTITAFDAPQDPVTIAFDFNNDGVFDEVRATGSNNPTVTTSTTFSTAGVHPVRIRATDDDGGVVESVASVVIQPRVQFRVASQVASESVGGSTVIVEAEIDQAIAESITIPLVVSGTADFGDYEPAIASLVIPAGATLGQTVITLRDDPRVDGAKTLILSMQRPSNALLGARSVHTITIDDDDRPPVPHPGGPYLVDEGTPLQLDASGTTDANQASNSLEYQWDLNYDGVTFDVDASGMRPTVSFADNGPERTIALRVADVGGASALATTTLLVRNAAPLIQAVTTNGPVAPGQPVTVTIQATDRGGSLDPLRYEFDFDGDGLFETSGASASAQRAYGAYGTYAVAVRVLDDDGGVVTGSTSVLVAPRVSFDAAGATWDESAGTVAVRATLEEAVGVDVVVPLLVGGSAEFADYTAAFVAGASVPQLSLRIPAGSLSGEITLKLIDDNRDEEVDVLTLTMGTPTGAALGAITLHTVTIADNDIAPHVTFDGNPFAGGPQSEGANIPLRAILSHPSDFLITVPIVVSGDLESGDYQWMTSAGATLQIAPGNLRSAINGTVLGLRDDSAAERVEKFTLSLGPATNATVNPLGNTSLSGLIDVSDMPKAVLKVDSNWFPLMREELAQEQILTVTLSQPSPDWLSLPFQWIGSPGVTRGAGGDFELIGAGSNSIQFAPGQTSAQIRLKVQNDSLAEKTETIAVTLLDSPQIAVTGFDRKSASVEIRDDDTVAIGLPDRLSVWEDGGRIPVTIALSNPAAFEYSLILKDETWNGANVFKFMQGGQELVRHLPSKTVTLTVPANATSVTFDLQILDDRWTEAQQTIDLTLDRSTNAPPGDFEPGRPSRIQVDVLDDDPLIGFVNSGPSDVREGIQIATQTVGLFTYAADGRTLIRGKSNKPVVVEYAYRLDTPAPNATLGTDFDLTWNSLPASVTPLGQYRARLTIPAGASEGFLPVQILDDQTRELTEQFEVTLVSVPSETAYLNVGLPRTHLTRILDNDQVRVALSASREEVTEGESFDVIVSIDRDPAPGEVVTVTVDWNQLIARQGGDAARGHDDFVFTAQTLTFMAGQPREQRLTVQVKDEDVVELRESIGFRLSRLSTAIQGVVTSPPGAILSNSQTVVWIAASDQEVGPVQAGTLGVGTPKPQESYPPGTPGLPQTNVPLPPGPTSPAPGSSTSPTIPTGSIGVVTSSDGYLGGGFVFFDGNRNGQFDFLDLNGNLIQDAGEPEDFTITVDQAGAALLRVPAVFDRNGDGVVDFTEGQLVAVGGTDTSTMLPSRIRLRAPAGHFVISPITTLVSELITRGGMSLSTALTTVRTRLGLPEGDLSVLGFVYESSQGHADSQAIYAQAVAVHNTAIAWSRLLSQLPGAPSEEELGDAVYAALARLLKESTGPVDLGNAVVQEVLLESLVSSQRLTFSAPSIREAASLLAELNARILALPRGEGFVTRLARIQVVVQGTFAAQLGQVASGATTMESVVTAFSGPAVDALIATAQTGNITPVFLTYSDVRVVEQNAGETFAEFSIGLTAPSVLPVSVAYQTIDGSASSAVGDYEFTAGTLTWAAGETAPRLVRVRISGDAEFEADELFSLRFSEFVNVAVKTADPVATIENDDVYTFAATTGDGDSHFALFVSGAFLQLTRNGQILVAGPFDQPARIEVEGAAGVQNRLDVEIDPEIAPRAHQLIFRGLSTTDALVLKDWQQFETRSVETLAGQRTVTIGELQLRVEGVESVESFRLPTVSSTSGPFTFGSPASFVAAPPAGGSVPGLRWEVLLGGWVVASGNGAAISYQPVATGEHRLRISSTDAGLGQGTLEVPFVVQVAGGSISRPVFSALNDGTLTYLENAGLLTLNSSVQVEFATPSSAASRSVTVLLSTPVDSADRLVVVQEGHAPGQISLMGDTLLHGGQPIGTVTGGTASTPLVIRFQPGVSSGVIQTVLRRLAFENASDNPVGGLRTIELLAIDGDGSASLPATLLLNVVPVNDAPGLGGIGPAVSWMEGAAPVRVLPLATVADADSASFEGGVLTLELLNGQASDELAIRSEGDGLGQIDVVNGFVRYEGRPIGAVGGGTGLSIALSEFATAESIQQLLRSIEFTNRSSGIRGGARTLAVTLTDGDGGMSPVASQVISVQAVLPTATWSTVPGVRTTALGVVTVTFSEDVTGVTLSDFTLTRDDVLIDLIAAPFTQINPRQYTLDLSAVTAPGGDYALKVRAADSGIADLGQNLFAADATVTWTNLQVSGFLVQGGQVQRSFVNRVDLTLAGSFELATLLTGARVRLTRYGLDGLNGVTVNRGTITRSAQTLTLDWGSQGIGGNRNSVTGDGYYVLELDLDGDGLYDTQRRFYRLMGDVNGDRVVNAADASLIQSQIGRPYSAIYDLDGNGIVDARDRLIVMRSNNRQLNAMLLLDG